MEYILFFIDEDGNPEEWAVSSTSFSDAIHYLNIYSQYGDVGIFQQADPSIVTVDGKPVVMRMGEGNQ